jgi:hypothetical protein
LSQKIEMSCCSLSLKNQFGLLLFASEDSSWILTVCHSRMKLNCYDLLLKNEVMLLLFVSKNQAEFLRFVTRESCRIAKISH